MNKQISEYWKLQKFEGTYFGNGLVTAPIKGVPWKVFHARSHDRVFIVHAQGCFELSQTMALQYGLIRRIRHV